MILWALCCLAALGQAQQRAPGMLVGAAFDSVANKPLQGATVSLRRADSSSFFKSLVTRDDGYFSFVALPYGYYHLQISMVGFGTLRIDSIHIRAERFDFNMGDLKLGASDSELQNVVVYVEKPMLESKDGKVTFNAGESALSAGSTTAELLKTLPLVSNDPNGKLLLRGKEPRILIDDKPVDLNGQQLADLLESMPGGAIERIELMQNPPPEFGTDAGGVINIITKKGKVGLTGRVSLSAGTRGEGNAGANISYRQGKWNLNGVLNVGASQLLGYNNSYRQNRFADSSNRFNTEGDFDNRNLRPNLRLQADADLSKQHQLSAVLQANVNYFDNQSLTAFSNINRFDQLWRYSQRSIAAEGYSSNFNPQLTWQYKGKKHGENLRLVTSLSSGRTDNDRNFLQAFLDPATQAPLGLDSSQQQLTNNRYVNTQTRLNYNRQLFSKQWTLNAGAGFLSTHNDNELQSLYLDKTQNAWLPAAGLSNSFLFDQAVWYLRGGFTWAAGKWRIVAYVQPEWTRFSVKDKTTQAASSNTFANWLPGATIRRDLSKQTNLSLVYRQSIRRPGAGELNPAIDYGDPYNLRFGNPNLQPSTAHNFDLNLGYNKGKSFINGSLGFNLITDIIASIRTLQPDGKTYTTYQNIASRREYEASFWSGYSFSKTVRVNLSTGYTYMYYRQSLRQQFGYRNGGSFYSTVNYNLTFSGVFSMDGSIRYSNWADPQGRSRSNVNTNFGVQHKFLQRRLILSFNVIDPFTPQENISRTVGQQFTLDAFRSSRTRNFRLSIAWQLNKILLATVPSSSGKRGA